MAAPVSDARHLALLELSFRSLIPKTERAEAKRLLAATGPAPTGSAPEPYHAMLDLFLATVVSAAAVPLLIDLKHARDFIVSEIFAENWEATFVLLVGWTYDGKGQKVPPEERRLPIDKIKELRICCGEDDTDIREIVLAQCEDIRGSCDVTRRLSTLFEDALGQIDGGAAAGGTCGAVGAAGGGETATGPATGGRTAGIKGADTEIFSPDNHIDSDTDTDSEEGFGGGAANAEEEWFSGDSDAGFGAGGGAA